MTTAPHKVDETASLRQGQTQPLPFGVFALFTPDEAMPRDRGLHVKRRGGLTLAAFLLIILCWALGQSPGFVENVYAQGFSLYTGRALAWATGWLPTSVAELLVFGLLGWLLISTSMALWHVIRRRRRFFNAAATGTLRWLCIASVTIALFYVLWGVNYFRAPLIERQGWQQFAADPTSRDAQTQELVAVCEALVDATNAEYMAVTASDDAGHATAPMLDLTGLDAAIDEGYERLAREMQLGAGFAASRGRAKPIAASFLMPWLNIGGFYFPWTGEANFNHQMPWCLQPHVIAHEKAHQRCITSEDEANFFGFAACVRSSDPYVRYSGYLFAQRQMLSELWGLDRAMAAELIKRRHKGVQRDIDDVRTWWLRYQQGMAATVAQVSAAVNDTYLKVNQVQAGVQSYDQSSRLLLAFARKHGGVVPQAAQ